MEQRPEEEQEERSGETAEPTRLLRLKTHARHMLAVCPPLTTSMSLYEDLDPKKKVDDVRRCLRHLVVGRCCCEVWQQEEQEK